MSWPEPRFGPGAHRSARLSLGHLGLLVTVVASLALSACGTSGFRPLYASSDFGGTGVSEKMAQVSVAPIPGRVGQQIRNELIYQTTGGGKPLPPSLRLEVAIRETVSSTLVDRTADSRSQIYSLDASFRLIDIQSKEVLLSGKSYGRAPFERFDSIFANVRARQDAEDRAAKTVGTELKTRLEAFLASRPA